MNAERIIAEIEWLEQLFRLPDSRPLQTADWKVGNQKANEANINNACPRLPEQEWLEHLLALPDNRLLQIAKAGNPDSGLTEAIDTLAVSVLILYCCFPQRNSGWRC